MGKPVPAFCMDNRRWTTFVFQREIHDHEEHRQSAEKQVANAVKKYSSQFRNRALAGVCGMLLLLRPIPALAQPDLPLTIPLKGDHIDVDVAGNVYLLSSQENVLRLYDAAFRPMVKIGEAGWDEGRFDRPASVWARNGVDIFVADYGNHRIQRFDRVLNFVSELSTHESDNATQRFGYPTDVALSRLGELFIVDSENQKIVKVNSQNTVVNAFGGYGAGQGRLHTPTRLEIGPGDNIYVIDGERVVAFDAFGNFVHELYKGMLRHPSDLFGDDRRLMVLDGDSLYCFDKHERQVGVQDVRALVGERFERVTSLATVNGKLYLLGDFGLRVIQDPFDEALTKPY